ncbi:hypothetical protein FQN55_001591, partial [Onygenales sp. PD_40]
AFTRRILPLINLLKDDNKKKSFQQQHQEKLVRTLLEETFLDEEAHKVFEKTKKAFTNS